MKNFSSSRQEGDPQGLERGQRGGIFSRFDPWHPIGSPWALPRTNQKGRPSGLKGQDSGKAPPRVPLTQPAMLGLNPESRANIGPQPGVAQPSGPTKKPTRMHSPGGTAAPERSLSSSPTPGSQCNTCPQDWVNFQRKCYYFSRGSKKWLEARKACQQLNGKLVSIHSQEEQVGARCKGDSGPQDSWFGPPPVVLWAESWLCAQEYLLARQGKLLCEALDQCPGPPCLPRTSLPITPAIWRPGLASGTWSWRESLSG